VAARITYLSSGLHFPADPVCDGLESAAAVQRIKECEHRFTISQVQDRELRVERDRIYRTHHATVKQD
jgi:hypothetical protein